MEGEINRARSDNFKFQIMIKQARKVLHNEEKYFYKETAGKRSYRCAAAGIVCCAAVRHRAGCRGHNSLIPKESRAANTGAQALRRAANTGAQALRRAANTGAQALRYLAVLMKSKFWQM